MVHLEVWSTAQAIAPLRDIARVPSMQRRMQSPHHDLLTFAGARSTVRITPVTCVSSRLCKQALDVYTTTTHTGAVMRLSGWQRLGFLAEGLT